MSARLSRLLLKLSGEALGGDEGAFSPPAIKRVGGELAAVRAELAIVIGGGNVLRGGRAPWLDRVEADTLGMLSTVLNGIALRAALEAAGREVLLQSAFRTEAAEDVSPRRAREALARGAIVLFAGGTGNPFVTTDSAAAISAVSVRADLLAKASNVGGVYTGDPRRDKKARLLPELTYDEFLASRYGVMDLAAVEICREHRLPIVVFDFEDARALAKLVGGKKVGTTIS